MIKTRICESCGKTFFGTTNRRAKRPLDPKAVEAANAKSETDCQRLDQPGTGEARRITMQGDDYLCRRVWMDAYLAALEDEPDKTVPKTRTPPDDPIEDCPLDDPIDPTIECAAIDIIALCEHQGAGIRSVLQGGALGIVPSTVYGADQIQLEARMWKACGEHPVWSVSGETDHAGVKHGFGATASVISKLWIPLADPKRYTATCTTCAGTRQVEVHAYPSNELSINLNLTELLKPVQGIIKRLEAALDALAGRFEWKVLDGNGSIQARWKEFTDERAFYAYDIGLDLSPLISCGGEAEIGPAKIAKLVGKIPGIGKYVDQVVDWLIEAKLYLAWDGGINIAVSYKRDRPDQPTFVEGLGSGLGGQIQGRLGAKGAVVGELIKVQLEASCAVKAGGAPMLDGTGFGLRGFEAGFDGLKGTCQLQFLWGWVDFNETVTFVEPTGLYGPEDLYVYRD